MGMGRGVAVGGRSRSKGMGRDRAGQGRAGQGRAGQGRAGQPLDLRAKGYSLVVKQELRGDRYRTCIW